MVGRNQRLKSTITIGSVMEKSVRKNIGFLKAGLTSVGGEISDISRRQKELAKQRRVLEREGRSVADLDREYEALTRQLGDLRAAQRRWENAAKSSRRVGKAFGNSVSQVGRLIRNSTVGFTAAGAAIVGLAGSTAQLGDDVAKTADRLGFSIEGLQEYRYAAERSGIGLSTFNSSILAMSKRLGEAKQGTGAAVKAIEQLGLSADTLAAMKPEDAMAAIADEMQKIKNPTEKAAIAAALFSRSGISMVNMLSLGSEGMAKLREDARKTGYVLSEKAARDAEAYQDALLDAQLTIKGLRNTLGAELMPVVTQAFRDFGSFMQNNREGVVAFAKATADGLERALPIVVEVAGGIGTMATRVGSVVSRVAEMIGGWENFGIALGAVMASKAVLAVGSLVGSVFSLGGALATLATGGSLGLIAKGLGSIGAVLVANPIGAVITGIAVAATLLVTNWERVEPVIRPVLDWMKKAAPGLADAWSSAREGIRSALDAIGRIFERLRERVAPVMELIKSARSFAGNAWGRVFGSNDDQSEEPVARAVGGAFKAHRPVLVGEKGPELIYPRQAGFVAHNRALERMAGLVSGSDDGSNTAMQPAVPGPPSVVQNITINAQGTSAAEIRFELERMVRAAQSSQLFDGVYGHG